MPPLIAGNWKMHGIPSQLGEIEAVAALARVRVGRIHEVFSARQGVEGNSKEKPAIRKPNTHQLNATELQPAFECEPLDSSVRK